MINLALRLQICPPPKSFERMHARENDESCRQKTGRLGLVGETQDPAHEV